MKEFVIEVPLRWVDVDATPEAFYILRCAPWRPARACQA